MILAVLWGSLGIPSTCVSTAHMAANAVERLILVSPVNLATLKTPLELAVNALVVLLALKEEPVNRALLVSTLPLRLALAAMEGTWPAGDHA